MKYLFLFTSVVLLLSGCAQTGQPGTSPADYGYKNRISIKTYDVAKKWDVVPVGIKIEPAMEPGDILILKHRENEVARVYAKGNLSIDELRLRIRALGSGRIVVFLHKPDGTQSVWSRNIKVNSFGKIPEKNTKRLVYRKRIADGAVDTIIQNDSAATGFVKMVKFMFNNGQAIICGSKYLSPNPYLRVKPAVLTGNPKINIVLAKSKNDKCVAN